MNITLQHGSLEREIDLSLLSDHYDYEEEVETWQQEVREALGLDEDAAVPYIVTDYSDDIPERFQTPTGPTKTFWEYFDVMEDKDEPEKWWAAESLSIPASAVEEAFQGSYRSGEEFAQQLAEDLGLVPDDLSWPCSSIDWGHAASEIMMFDYCEEGGYYFRNL